MPLFAKNKPTKRVEFEGGWVELQHLSKGVKDEIASRLAALYKGLDEDTQKKMQEKNEMPDSIIDALGLINEVQYYKMSHAVKSWSENDVPITVESVKELDSDIFAVISNAVDEMNELNQTERKN